MDPAALIDTSRAYPLIQDPGRKGRVNDSNGHCTPLWSDTDATLDRREL